MAEALISILIERIAEVTFEKVEICTRYHYHIETAVGQLRSLRAFLKDAVARQRESEVLRVWLAEIRDVSGDLDDAIESYAFQMASDRTRGMVTVLKRLACICSRNEIESEIDSLLTRLSHLCRNLETYGILMDTSEPGGPYSRDQMRETSSHTSPDVIGLEEDVHKLVEELVKGDKLHRVVSICGMGGLGKTTIAKRVYRNDVVRCHFDCFAWAYVSQEFESRDVLEAILTALITANDEQRKEFAKMNRPEIARRLYTTLQEKKCLVVLDDIWTCEAWSCIKDAFPYEETKSQIILTTRNREVAFYADRNCHLYDARPLNKDESWQLFEKIAILGRDDGYTDSNTYAKKEQLGKEMLQSCGGLPLAIIVLAGLLARKNTVDEWKNVSENVGVYLREGGHFRSKYEGTSWVLALSYDNLPERLQLCFQYLGFFPKNYEIPLKRLTQLWMAEGLITPVSWDSEESMEDASHSYLNELVERCMVQVVKRGLAGNIKTCCLHDLMRDLCLVKAKEEKFLQVVNSSAAKEIQAAPCTRARRLAIHLDRVGDNVVPTSDEIRPHLKSLLYFVRGHFYSDRNRKLLQSLFKDFRFLRVLKFEDIKAEPEVELPTIVGKLVYLKFLSLKNSEIKRFPASMANLVQLQTLDLRCVEWVCVKIPNVFQKMKQLRHLYLPLNHRVREKLSVATLHNLQTLVNISSQDCDLKDLAELTNLRKLIIYAPGSKEFKNLEDVMQSRDITFDHLQSLSLMMGNGNGDIPTQIVLSCHHLYKLRLYGRIKEFSEDLLCSNLTKLTLEETHLKDDQIKILEKLQQLRMLYLRVGAFKSETMVFSQGFPQLEFLSLLGLCELKEWRVETGAMPRLCILHIGYCWGLKKIPDGLQYISTLKELTIKRMYREFCNRLEQGGEDFDKIRRIPSVTIANIR